jgi:hypothetical protein
MKVGFAHTRGEGRLTGGETWQLSDVRTIFPVALPPEQFHLLCPAKGGECTAPMR